jgi:GT2 family glycosyltransferase
MSKVVLIQQVYKSRRFIPQVYDAMIAQTHKDIEIISQIVDDEGGSKAYIQEHYPQVKILEPGYNIGFSRGHNEIFASTDADFFQLVNPDLILSPNFVEEMLKAFADPKVGAVSGKLLRYDFAQNKATSFIDTTGVIIPRSGNARDRGQHEIDSGQYDNQTQLLSVNGSGPMYRKAALEDVKMPIFKEPSKITPSNPPLDKGENQDAPPLKIRGGRGGLFEYFDEDFHSYYEDVDLGWRMVNAGWKCVYTPQALAFHGRAVGSSRKGYKKFISLVKHRNTFAPHIRRLSYKNRIFLFIKNSPKWYLSFFAREFLALGFAVIFETKTLGMLPEFFKQLPEILKKRKYIKAHRKISVSEMEKLFSGPK